jgi:ribosomal-protein-alanine N-acetyltransferase
VHAPVTFATPRLTGERLAERHLEELLCLHQDPQVMRTLGGARDAEWTASRLADQIEHWDRRGMGIYVVRERETGRFAGRVGLQAVVIDSVPEVEVLYALVPEFWGQGLATEAAGELVRIAFDVVDLQEVVAFTLIDNQASRRVMEKVGFLYERSGEHAGLPHVFYRLRVGDDAATTAFDQATRGMAARAARGDREAFANLYGRVAPALHAWVRLRTTPNFRAKIDPEEVVQETWARALVKLPEIDPRTPFRPWLFRVARYVLIESSRGVLRSLPEGGSSGDPLARLPDSATGAATGVARREALESFLDRAESLDPKDRELVVLRGLEGRPFDEIAQRIKGNASSLNKRWQRLRARLIAEGPPDCLL